MKLGRETIREVGDEALDKLKDIPHVLSVSTESTKFTANIDSKENCITVFVDKKLNEEDIPEEHRIPKEIDGVPVDVVELSSSDFQIGVTEVGKKPPSIQRLVAGGVRRG